MNEEEQLHEDKSNVAATIKSIGLKILILFFVLFLVGSFVFWKLRSSQSVENNASPIVSRTEINWQTHVRIRIKGKEITIPANVGIQDGETHPARMHTHEADNVIHIEKPAPVTEADIKLANFFQVWGKTLTQDCVLDSCNIDKGSLKMTVNGKDNNDFGEYLLHDHDEIVLDYE